MKSVDSGSETVVSLIIDKVHSQNILADMPHATTKKRRLGN